MTKENEIWVPIKGFEELYLISNYGEVKSIKKNIIIHSHNNKTGKGYLYVDLYIGHIRKKRAFIHRLIAEHFIPNSLNKKEVNHIDGNSLNNSINNLEWVTHQENILHSCRTLKNNIGFKVNGYNDHRKIPIIQIDDNGNEIERFDSIKQASEKLNISATYLRNHINGIYKSVKGKKFIKNMQTVWVKEKV